jgi:hypothetical protein
MEGVLSSGEEGGEKQRWSKGEKRQCEVGARKESGVEVECS